MRVAKTITQTSKRNLSSNISYGAFSHRLFPLFIHPSHFFALMCHTAHSSPLSLSTAFCAILIVHRSSVRPGVTYDDNITLRVIITQSGCAKETQRKILLGVRRSTCCERSVCHHSRGGGRVRYRVWNDTHQICRSKEDASFCPPHAYDILWQRWCVTISAIWRWIRGG